MAQWVKDLVVKSEDLSLIPRTELEGKKQLLLLSSDLHTHTMTHTYPTHTHTHNRTLSYTYALSHTNLKKQKKIGKLGFWRSGASYVFC